MIERMHSGLQRALLVLAYGLGRFARLGRRRSISWIVGPTEVAAMVHHIAVALPGSHSVTFENHPFYRYRYDSQWGIRAGTLRARVVMVIVAPVLLGFLAARARGIIYVGPQGFLRSAGGRRFELSFLRRRGLAISWYFTGSDIRSLRRMAELAEATGVANIGSAIIAANPGIVTDARERALDDRARDASDFADVIFSSTVDQLSAITRPTEPFLYFYPDEQIAPTSAKFEHYDRPVVVHAPSNPLIKGTPAVRAAIETLRAEGRDFEYVELQGVDNDTVLAELDRAHIVLNQFYAFVPGVFGIEAMARRCAVLMSADERHETDLPAGSNSAWEVTPIDAIIDNLRRLLDDPQRARQIADRAADWVSRHASASASRERLLDALEPFVRIEQAR